MMATKSFSRNHLYMKTVGYGLYVAAGFLAFQNMNFTLLAFKEAGINQTLAYSAVGFMAFIEAAVAIFLLSPSSWGEIARDLREETAQSVGSFSGTSRTAAAIVSGILVSLMVLLISVVYYADFISTAEGLGLSLTALGAQQYKTLLAVILVFGSELSSIVGYQVLRRSRESEILQNEEDSRLDPAAIYSRELKKHRVKEAKKAARSQAFNPEAR